MKTLKEFFVAAVLFGLTMAGCGNQGAQLSDLKSAAPGKVEIQSLMAREAQAGTCSEQSLMKAQSASVKPMIDPGNSNQPDPNANISFWISEMKTEENPDANPPSGDITYAFIYNDPANGFMVGILKISFEWDGEKWNQVNYRIECKTGVSGTIQGQAVNAVTGTPIEGALIYVESECGLSSPISYSDQGGRFQVSGMVPGKVTLRAYAPGFEDVTITGLEVQTGQALTLEYPVNMVPRTDKTFITVAGRISFRDGETPLAGVNLPGETHPTMVYLRNGDGTNAGQPGTVDSEGNFRILFVTPGEYQLGFFSQALSTLIDENGNQMGYITVNVEKDSGPVVQVGGLRADNMPPVIEGVESGMATMDPGQSVSITATATDPDQDSLAYYWKADGGALSLTQGNEIEWTAPDAPGTYTIEVIVNDGKGGADSGSIQITVYEEPK